MAERQWTARLYGGSEGGEESGEKLSSWAGASLAADADVTRHRISGRLTPFQETQRHSAELAMATIAPISAARPVRGNAPRPPVQSSIRARKGSPLLGVSPAPTAHIQQAASRLCAAAPRRSPAAARARLAPVPARMSAL